MAPVPTASGAGGRGQQLAVDPLGVLGDDGVDAGLLQLAALLPSIGGDAYRHATVEQRTPGVTLVGGWAECRGRIRAGIPHTNTHILLSTLLSSHQSIYSSLHPSSFQFSTHPSVILPSILCSIYPSSFLTSILHHPMYPSILPSTLLSIQLFFYGSLHPSITASTHLSFHPPHLSIYPSMLLSILCPLSILSISPFILPSAFHPSFLSSILPPIH